MKKNRFYFLVSCFLAFGATVTIAGCGNQTINLESHGDSSSADSDNLTPLSKGVSLPGQYPQGTFLSDSLVRQASAVSWSEENSDSADMPTTLAKQCLDQDLILESRPGPYNHPIEASNFQGNVLYVNAKVNGGDGSQAKPFHTIQSAVQAAIKSRKTAAILVAGGVYSEDIDLQPGLFLFGGFNATTWKRDLNTSPSVIKNLNGSLNINGNDTAEFSTILDGFTIYGSSTGSPSVFMGNDASAILRNNTIYMSMGEVTWQTYGDTHYGTAIEAYHAKAQIYHNRLLIDSPEPEHTISEGVFAQSSCITFANNHTQSYRNPFRSVSGQGSVWNNLLEDSFNGVSSYDEQLHIEGNVIGLLEHDNGCGYAIYLGAFGDNSDHGPKTNPKIIRNLLVLEGTHSRGINETYAEADPVSLIENIFVVIDPQSKPMLYGDYDQPHDQGKINKSLFTAEEIDALKDISALNGNVLIKN